MTKTNSLHTEDLYLWLISPKADLKPITKKEIDWSKNLSEARSFQYRHSRGYVRKILSGIINIPPLEIPLNAPPGYPPSLAKGFGYLSISHCQDNLLIGWCKENIGVDIERTDRSINARSILNRFYSKTEKEFLMNFDDKDLKDYILQYWVRKEAAIKWQKGSIFYDLPRWAVIDKYNKITNQSIKCSLFSFLLHHKNWYISLACNNNFNNIKPNIYEI